MGEAITRSRAPGKAADAEPQDRWQDSPLRQFERHLLIVKAINKSGRVHLQMKLMSGRHEFTMTVKTQAAQLHIEPWAVRLARREAVSLGLYEKTDKGYRRLDDGKPFTERWQACTGIDLKLRLMSMWIDMASGSDDGMAHPSIALMAARSGEKPSTVKTAIRMIRERKSLGRLFQIVPTAGGKNAYRPCLRTSKAEATATTASRSRLVDIVIKEFQCGDDFAQDIIKDLVRPARDLRLSDDDAKLVRALARLYQQMKAERNKVDLSLDWKLRLGTPYGLLGNYLDYIGEQEWRGTTTRVLDMSTPAFGQWRRWWMDGDGGGGLDPFTGPL